MRSNLKNNKYFIHVDGDNFFVSCELVRFPHLQNKPVVVGRERGIAVAMNQAAKKLGITRAMPVFEIRKRFPETVILPSHFESYRTFSKHIGTILESYMDTVEPYSIDEFFCTYTEKENVELEMNLVRQKIEAVLGITVSIGIAKTKALAKHATEIHKPNGTTFITEENRLDILKQIHIEDVWGVGRRTAWKWKNRGIHTAYGLAYQPLVEIEKCNLPVRKLIYELRSISQEHLERSQRDHQTSYQSTESFPTTNERLFLFSEISRHIEGICRQLISHKLTSNYIHIFIKDHNGRYTSSGTALDTATNNAGEIITLAENLFVSKYDPNYTYKKTGVTLSSINKAIQDNLPRSLFDEDNNSSYSQKDALKAILDDIELGEIKHRLRLKYGQKALYNTTSSKAIEYRIHKRKELQKIDAYRYGLPLPYLGVCS